MNWWDKLSVRMTVAIFLIAVIPLSVFGIATTAKIRKALLRSVEQTNLTAARDSATTIESSVEHTIENFRVILENIGLDTRTAYDREWMLQILLKSFPHISSMTITDFSGKQTLKVTREDTFVPENAPVRDDIVTALKSLDMKIGIGNLYSSEAGILHLPVDIFLINPVVIDDSIALTAEININRLLETASEHHFLNAGYLYVVDKNGRIILHPDKSIVLSGEKALYNPLVNLFISGGSIPQSLSQHMDRNNNPVVSNAFSIDHPRLLVVVEQPADDALASANSIVLWQKILMIAVVFVSVIFSFYFIIKLIRPLKNLEQGARQIGTGEFGATIPVISSDEIGNVTQAFNTMVSNLKLAKKKDADLLWVEQGFSKLDNIIRGGKTISQFGHDLINFLCEYTQAHIGLLYTFTDQNTYKLASGFAINPRQDRMEEFSPGQGLIGQCVIERTSRYLQDLPSDFFTISSSLGQILPRQSAIIPFAFNDFVEGVVELGLLESLTDVEKQFLEEAADRIAVAMNTARSRKELKNKKNELQSQQEKLQASNEELEKQTRLLTDSEVQLKQQQEELQATNEELEEKTEVLERERKQIEEKNRVLEKMRVELSKKADDLILSNKYKSEFLANMSHELRTPLNSLLLLSKILLDNKEKNLTEDQKESARIIFSSGSDLLTLINEILDLSKIEAGKIELNRSNFNVQELADSMRVNFSHFAVDKGLSFTVKVEEGCPSSIISDFKRIQQILKNLIDNAIKFTSKGGVYVSFYRPDDTTMYFQEDLSGAAVLAISVKDTGIGIASDKKALIFEAFHQSDGGITRKYGGTGLGLSICKALSKLLGGEIQLGSPRGSGAVLTLFLPVEPKKNNKRGLKKKPDLKLSDSVTEPDFESSTEPPLPDIPTVLEQHLPDDRNKITPGDISILIIDDDIHFGQTLLNFCRNKGFLCLYSSTGENGLKLARHFNPKAVILDVKLPGIDGWAVFDALKANAVTRHIPVHFMSVDEPMFDAINRGAIGYLTKPVSKENLEAALEKIETLYTQKMKSLLIVEAAKEQFRTIGKLVEDLDITVDEASTGKEALNAVIAKSYDCIILDLDLPDITGVELLDALENTPDGPLPPIIVYTDKELSTSEEVTLRKYTQSIIVKGGRSEERLFDEISLFLHRMSTKTWTDKKQILTDIDDGEHLFNNKTILIVDDDMRNLFALSKILGERKMTVLKAENGQKAIDLLKKKPGIDLVLMDIMMPVMDGYEAMKQIRSDKQFNKLPIIALTAKAMKQDKTDCIQAGASDYLTKPIDINRLFSMMRVWLYESS